MQEQINEKTVALSVKSTKITGRMLAKIMRATVNQMKKQKIPHGKQSIKKLTQQGASLKNIEITDDNIKSFERVARKYSIDFALKKDVSTEPPKWLVFFKAKDADSLTAAFSEFSAKVLNKTKAKEKPPILAQISKFKQLIKNAVIDRVKNKNRGGHEL
jgi:hypothetical protein